MNLRCKISLVISSQESWKGPWHKFKCLRRMWMCAGSIEGVSHSQNKRECLQLADPTQPHRFCWFARDELINIFTRISTNQQLLNACTYQLEQQDRTCRQASIRDQDRIGSVGLYWPLVLAWPVHGNYLFVSFLPLGCWGCEQVNLFPSQVAWNYWLLRDCCERREPFH